LNSLRRRGSRREFCGRLAKGPIKALRDAGGCLSQQTCFDGPILGLPWVLSHGAPRYTFLEHLRATKATSSNKSTLMAKPWWSGFNPTSADQPPRRVETRPTKSDVGVVHCRNSPMAVLVQKKVGQPCL
jgi:hypothetical protein